MEKLDGIEKRKIEGWVRKPVSLIESLMTKEDQKPKMRRSQIRNIHDRLFKQSSNKVRLIPDLAFDPVA